MTKSGWHHESGRHSLAARGVKTRCRSPSKTARHGPRAATVAKWFENWFESYRQEQISKERKLMKEINMPFEEPEGGRYSSWTKDSFMLYVGTGKSENGQDYVEVRTDGSAYELFYDTSVGDFGSIGEKAQEKLREDMAKKFPGLYFEHEGGGVLRAYLWNIRSAPAKPRKFTEEEKRETTEQESRYNENMERQISKYETDYTGEYTRGH